MKIEAGYLYHIIDEFFDNINDRGMMINHEKSHSRPICYTIIDDDII